MFVLWQGGYLELCPTLSKLLGSLTFRRAEHVMWTAAGEAGIVQLLLVEEKAP